MRIIHKAVDRVSGEGRIKLVAQEPDDMYHLYNLIVAEDEVESSTVRNVTRESKTGSIQKERIRMVLTISVVRVEYDAEQGASLCVSCVVLISWYVDAVSP
jgi:protein pelota